MSNFLQPHGLYSPWNSPDQNTGVGSLSLLQGIFPTQESNRDLRHCRQILYQVSYLAQLIVEEYLFLSVKGFRGWSFSALYGEGWLGGLLRSVFIMFTQLPSVFHALFLSSATFWVPQSRDHLVLSLSENKSPEFCQDSYGTNIQDHGMGKAIKESNSFYPQSPYFIPFSFKGTCGRIQWKY